MTYFLRRVSQSPVPQRGSREATVLVERMAIEIEGEGEPVLMIHGLGGTSNTFTPMLAALTHHRAVRFDLPGSGRSHRVEGPLSLALFLDKTRVVLQRVGVERAHVVAHSMGTIIATHLAASDPGRVASLTLFGPLLAPPEPARAALRARAVQARAGDMQPIADALLRVSVASETRARRPAAVAFVRESLMRQDPESYARTCEALAEMGPPTPPGSAARRCSSPATRTPSPRPRQFACWASGSRGAGSRCSGAAGTGRRWKSPRSAPVY